MSRRNVVVVGALALGVGFGSGLTVARSAWRVPCELRFDRYARKCEGRVMACEAQQHVL